MVTDEMVDAQNKRIADGISAISSQIDELRAENRRLRDALFQFNYPPDPKVLREIADEIDCGNDCEHGHVEWDTNAHNCSRERRAEGCSLAKAWELRQFADAVEVRNALNASHAYAIAEPLGEGVTTISQPHTTTGEGE
jgi:hypothetical protein